MDSRYRDGVHTLLKADRWTSDRLVILIMQWA